MISNDLLLSFIYKNTKRPSAHRFSALAQLTIVEQRAAVSADDGKVIDWPGVWRVNRKTNSSAASFRKVPSQAPTRHCHAAYWSCVLIELNLMLSVVPTLLT